MNALYQRTSQAGLALFVVLAAGRCTSRSTGQSHVAVTSAAVTNGPTGPVTVTSVSGYANCTEPACADVARACDDIIRSGCGAPFLTLPDGGVFAAQSCTSKFAPAVAACTVAVWGELWDSAEDLVLPDAAPSGLPPRAVIAAELAKCTRRASTCAQRIECTRGLFVPPHLSYDAGAPFAPPYNADAATPPPSWTTPWRGDGPRSLWSGAPWQNGSGEPRVELIAGVDSPSCARCTIQRCPTFAYRCFSAEGDATECPSGDCCQSLRKCVERCGGYSRQSSLAQFYSCMSQCETTRPHAAQELADLQNCAKVACEGCQAFDQQGSQVMGRP